MDRLITKFLELKELLLAFLFILYLMLDISFVKPDIEASFWDFDVSYPLEITEKCKKNFNEICEKIKPSTVRRVVIENKSNEKINNPLINIGGFREYYGFNVSSTDPRLDAESISISKENDIITARGIENLPVNSRLVLDVYGTKNTFTATKELEIFADAKKISISKYKGITGSQLILAEYHYFFIILILLLLALLLRKVK